MKVKVGRSSTAQFTAFPWSFSWIKYSLAYKIWKESVSNSHTHTHTHSHWHTNTKLSVQFSRVGTFLIHCRAINLDSVCPTCGVCVNGWQWVCGCVCVCVGPPTPTHTHGWMPHFMGDLEKQSSKHTHTHTQTLPHTYTDTHAQTHTHTHTHTQRRWAPRVRVSVGILNFKSEES